MEILYKSPSAVVVYKPRGIPSQKDPSGDADALALTSAALAEMGESGTLYPVHRLDRVVGGVMIIARTKAAAVELSAAVSDGDFSKEYLAVAEGTVPSGIMTDYLYKDSVAKIARVVDEKKHGGKLATLECHPLSVTDGASPKTLVRVVLHTGRFHQIRAQLASRRHSLLGDKKYGNRDPRAKMPALFAYKLSVKLSGESISVTRLPDTSEYPWSLFNITENTLIGE